MTDDEFDINQELRELYHNPAVGYRGAEHSYETAKEEGLDESRTEVRKFLRTQDTYTRNFPKGQKRKKFRPTVVGSLGQQLQMDLLDMTDSRKANNDGNRYILLYEFKNPQVNKLLNELEIKSFSTLIKRTGWHPTQRKKLDGTREIIYGPYTLFQRKAAIVERLNRTLKNIMWKYFDEHKTDQWIHILDDITHNYNNSVNRSIKMRPNQVNEDNAKQVWSTLYADKLSSDPPKPKFKVGDIVRVKKYHPETRHVKGYTINFTEELFKIIEVYRSDPIKYKIQGIDEKNKQGDIVKEGQVITGRFYKRELTKING